MPVIANVTILNALSVASELSATPVWRPGANGELLQLRFTHSAVVWPWTGFLGVSLQVAPEGASFKGTATGVVVVQLNSVPAVRVVPHHPCGRPTSLHAPCGGRWR